MAKQNSSKTKLIASSTIAKLLILVICFVAVFSIAMFTGVFNFESASTLSAENGSVMQVAEAANPLISNMDQPTVRSDMRSAIGVSGQTYKWFYISDLDDYAFTSTNYTWHAEGGPGVSAMYGDGTFGCKSSDANSGFTRGQAYSMANFVLPTYLADLLGTGNYNVYATVYADVTNGTDGNNAWELGLHTGVTSGGLHANVEYKGSDSEGTYEMIGGTKSGTGNRIASKETAEHGEYTFTSPRRQFSTTNKVLSVGIYGQRGSSRTKWIEANNISIMWEVELKGSSIAADDNGATHVVNEYISANPMITSDDIDNPTAGSMFDGMHQDLKNVFKKHTDSVDSTNTNIKLKSFTNSFISGKDYYKTVQLKYNYKSGSNKVVGLLNQVEVVVGDNEPVLASNGTILKDGDRDVAKINLTPTNVGGKITSLIIDVNFYDNAIVEVYVNEYLNSTIKPKSTKIEVAGIDADAPILPELEDYTDNLWSDQDGAVVDWDSLNWLFDRKFETYASVSVSDDDMNKDYFAPYAWFYDVAKIDDPNGSFGAINTYTADQLFKRQPIDIDSFEQFVHDFSAETKGGYYRFVLYAVDLAGNVASGQTVYFAKSDHVLPTVDIALNIGNGEQYIDDPADNGVWANDKLTVVLTRPSGRQELISGWTLTFGDNNNDEHVITSDGIYLLSHNGIQLQRNKKSVNISDDIKVEYDGTYGIIRITYSENPDEVGVYTNFDYLASYQLTQGTNPDADGANTEINSSWIDSKTKAKGVWVKVDRNAPNNADILDEDGFVKDGTMIYDGEGNISNGNSIIIDPASREWFTNGYSLGASVDFMDSLSGKYGNDIKVYYAMKYINSDADFYNGEDYQLMSEDNYTDAKYGMYLFKELPLSSFGANNVASIDLRFNQSLGDGMREIYVWTKDQAGNFSNIASKYILVDGNRYNVLASIDKSIFPQNSTISIKDEDGVARTEFKRGEKVVFEIDIEEGFIPWRFNQQVDESGTMVVRYQDNSPNTGFASYQDEILNIYGSNIEFLIESPNYKEGTTDEGYGFKLSLPNNKVIVQVQNRKHITADVTSQSVVYTGEGAKVPMILSDETAKSDIVTSFISDGDLLDYTPIVPGDYLVSLMIPNEEYSLENASDPDYANRCSSKYVMAPINNLKFKIMPRTATVRVANSFGYYGDDNQVVKFVIENLSDLDAEKFSAGTLNYDGAFMVDIDSQYIDTDADILGNPVKVSRRAPVGRYDVFVASDFALEHYNLVVETGFHRINPKVIDVKLENSSKIFNSNDPLFQISFNSDELVNGDQVADVFYNATEGRGSDAGRIMLLADVNVLRRNAGETAGVYEMINDLSAIEVHQNYTVSLSTDADALGSLTIEQKQVKLVVHEGQNIIVSAGESYADRLQDVTVAWEFEQLNDLGYAKFMNAGKLSITPTSFDSSDLIDPDYITYSHKIEIGSLAVKDEFLGSLVIDIAELEDAVFIVYEQRAEQKYVVISLKDGQSIQKTYGDGWDATVDAQFSASKFNVVGLEEVANYSISWLADIDFNGNYPSVGNYKTAISDIVIIDGDGAQIYGEDSDGVAVASEYSVKVESFFIEYIPYLFEIKPVLVSNTKTYGQSDDVYGFDFEILNDEFNSDIVVSKDTISGAFARGIYNSLGELKQIGSLFDNATDQNGLVYTGDILAQGDYYAVAVAVPFESSNPNYKVEVAVDELSDTKLVVNRAKIFIDKSKFVGVNKSYDGNNKVIYPSDVVAVSVQSDLQFASDIVVVQFDARYDSAEVGQKIITFSNITLGGVDGFNYELWEDNDFVWDSNETIKIDRITFGSDEYIQILKVTEFTVRDTTFNFNKEYDGTIGLDSEDILIDAGNPLANVDFILAGDYNFNTANVISSNFAFDSVTLFFPIINPENNWTYKADEDATNVSVEFVVDAVYGEGIKVVLTNANAIISPKTINPEDISSISAVDRAYNATNKVDILYTLKSGVLVTNNLGKTDECTISFSAVVDSKDVNFDGSQIAGKNGLVSFDAISVSNSNYKISRASFESFYQASNQIFVKITPALLTPSVVFDDDKQYNADSALQLGSDYTINNINIEGTNYGTFTAEELSDELIDELSDLVFVSDDLELTLSNGKDAYAGVQYDENGRVVGHNVLVQNLNIKALNGADLAELFANYRLNGLKYYTDSDNEGNVGDLAVVVVAGVFSVYDYEVAELATLDRKILNPTAQTGMIKDKIYDGTKTAECDYDVFNIDSELTHANGVSHANDVELRFVAEFDSADAGQNVTVQVRVDGFYDITENEVAKNYTIADNYKVKSKASISKAPLTIEFKARDKVYDGTIDLNIRDIDYEFFGLYMKDSSNYGVVVDDVFYDDKNASTEANNYLSQGNVYGISLRNTQNRNAINYTLANLLASSTTELSEIESEYGNYSDVADAIANGEIYVVETVQSTGAVLYNYYKDIESSKKFVLSSVFDAKSDAEKANFDVLGSYMVDGDKVYVVDTDIAVDTDGVQEFANEINFIGFEGRIDRKSISISVAKPDGYDTDIKNTPYFKYFDATNKFSGANGVDYVLNTSLMFGLIAGDVIELNSSECVGTFEQTHAGDTRVVFNITQESITGADAGNYIVAENSSYFIAKIAKNTIHATLGDDSISYGSINNIYNNISYKLSVGGNAETQYDIIRIGNSLYMLTDDVALAYPDYTGYKKYAIDADGQVSEDSVSGTYAKLSGNYSFPTGSASITSKTPVGEYPYYLTGGSSSNYNFARLYTTVLKDKDGNIILDKDGNETPCSLVEVLPIDIYVYAYGTYSRFYGETNPTIELRYTSTKDGFENGFNQGQSAESVFGKNLPIAMFKLWNGSEFVDGEVAMNALLSGDLLSGSFYAVELNIDACVSDNYKLHLKYDTADKYVKLMVNQPTIDDVEIANAEVTYNGADRSDSVIKTAGAGGDVSYVVKKHNGTGWDIITTAPINAGRYQIEVTITREIDLANVNGEKYNCVDYVQTAELNILKSDVGLYSPKQSANYDFGTQTFNKSLIKTDVAFNDIASVTMTYTFVPFGAVDVDPVTVYEIKDAGTYVVNLHYQGNENFNAENDALVVFTVAPIKINVTVDQSSLVQVYESGKNNVAFTYDLSQEFKDMGLTTADIPSIKACYIGPVVDGEFTYIDIAATGIYNYEILVDRDDLSSGDKVSNYKITNNIGKIKVGQKNVVASASNSSFAVPEGQEGAAGVTLADAFRANVITENSKAAVDINYFLAVSAHASKLDFKNKSGNLAAVVRYEFTQNGYRYVPSNELTMTTAIPDSVDFDKKVRVYFVTADGALAELTDYKVENNSIVYTTSEFGALVFVDFATSYESWEVALIVIFTLLLLAIAIAVTVTVALKVRARRIWWES